MSRAELSRRSGIPYPTLAGIENGDQNGSSKIARLAEALRCRARWLEDGTGEIEVPDGDNVRSNRDAPGMAPVISWVQAGSWNEIVDNFQPGDADEWRPVHSNAGRHAFFLRVEGESMYNPAGKWSYRPGELICVDPDRAAQNLDRVVVRIDDKAKATFKQLVIEDGRSFLKALNPDWPERIIEITEDATICGVVIGKWVDE